MDSQKGRRSGVLSYATISRPSDLGSTLLLFTIEVSEVLSKAGGLLLASMIRETSGLLMKRWRITVQLQITRSIQRLGRAPRDYW